MRTWTLRAWRVGLLSGLALAAAPAHAFIAYVSNEKSNTVSVIDTESWTVTKTIKVGQRPRGIDFTRDGKFVMVAVGDDDTIQMIDAKTQTVVDSLPSGPDPELFAQDAAGKVLYVANENDNTVTVIDLEKRARLGDIQVGVEPEGMTISPDGKTLINTSETTNMAHFIDTSSRQIVANVLVDARPRFAEFKHDASELWVSSEIGGTVSIIDPGKARGDRQDQFRDSGVEERGDPARWHRHDPGRQDRLHRARSRQPRRRGRRRDAQGDEISAGRTTGLAHGIHAGRKVSAHHQWRVERRLRHRRRRAKGDQDHSGGRTALGYHDRAMTSPAPIAEQRETPRPDPAAVPALSIDGVSHAYGQRRALMDVSFNVQPASFTALLGLNGAGKSTLFSLITRLFGIQSGRVGIFGHDISKSPGEALRLLGVVFQPRTLDLDLSLTQNLLYHAALHGISRREARARAAELLDRIGLTERGGSKVRDLSGGQMRRLEIARALLHRPRLLLLDEPTVGLDVKARADIISHVRQLVSEQGIGVLWATHLFDEIMAGDDLVVLHQGKVLAQGPMSRVIAEAGAQDVNTAFMRLTGAQTLPGGGA